MASYQKILVVINSKKATQEALKRAMTLVKKAGAHIKVFFPINDQHISVDVATQVLPRPQLLVYYNKWLKALTRAYQRHCSLAENITLETKASWHYEPYKAIIEEVINGQYQLVLKEDNPQQANVMEVPLDWQLLRKCPCPIWLVKNALWTKQINIIVAVNLTTDDLVYEALNTKSIQQAKKLQQQIPNAMVHIVGAYYEATDMIAIEVPEFDLFAYNETIRGQFLLAMKALRQQYAIDDKQTHMLQGSPDQVLVELATQLSANIIVVGCLGRTGISAALIGNTTERLSEKLPCDILTVKLDASSENNQ